MIDCGADWASKINRLNPGAILLTHAHPDHAGGLKAGAPCPVYATAETWSGIRVGTVPQRCVIELRSELEILGITFEAFPVEHSIRAPAVGYRMTGGKSCAFYVPDVSGIRCRHEALAGIQLYIGDGASLTRPILRKRDAIPIGHASIRMQLEWCREEGVPCAIFSHCGSQIVAGDEKAVIGKLNLLASAAGVSAMLAYDGLNVTL